jgi:hypothetical protein
MGSSWAVSWRRRCVVAVVAVVGFALGAPSGAWAVNDVCTSGCEWNSIDAAVGGEAAGTTFTGLQGVYNEDVSIPAGKDGQTINGPKAGQDARTRSQANEAIVNGGWTIER